LNTGEITNLFNSEEIELLIGEMRDYDIELGRTGTKDSVYSTFVDRVRDKLHIVLCMSPVGDNLRSRCRKFPSLVNCCTLDYFHQWPLSALLSVSQNLVRQLR
jgi:dynein heavy chain, axonemal